MNDEYLPIIGIVPYANVLPLLEGLDEYYPKNTWVSDVPRKLAEKLRAGKIDVAMLPIFEVLSHNDYRLVPGCAIASKGPVRSVQIFSNIETAEIKNLLIDCSSLTSAHLGQVILRDHIGISPKVTLSDAPLDSSFDLEASEFDAFLTIGDVALEFEESFPHHLDLGEAWTEMTNLPFVFAAWVARPGVTILGDDVRAFVTARKFGQSSLFDIGKRVGGDDVIKVRKYIDYLSKSIHYRLGEDELAGIAEFTRRLRKHGFIGNDTGNFTLLDRPPDTSGIRQPI